MDELELKSIWINSYGHKIRIAEVVQHRFFKSIYNVEVIHQDGTVSDMNSDALLKNYTLVQK